MSAPAPVSGKILRGHNRRASVATWLGRLNWPVSLAIGAFAWFGADLSPYQAGVATFSTGAVIATLAWAIGAGQDDVSRHPRLDRTLTLIGRALGWAFIAAIAAFLFRFW